MTIHTSLRSHFLLNNTISEVVSSYFQINVELSGDQCFYIKTQVIDCVRSCAGLGGLCRFWIDFHVSSGDIEELGSNLRE